MEKYQETHFIALIEEHHETRETIINDILELIRQSAYQSIKNNFLQADDIAEYLFPSELEYLRKICSESRLNRLN